MGGANHSLLPPSSPQTMATPQQEAAELQQLQQQLGHMNVDEPAPQPAAHAVVPADQPLAPHNGFHYPPSFMESGIEEEYPLE